MNEGKAPDSRDRFLLVPVFLAALVIFLFLLALPAEFASKRVYEPPLLLLALNTLFITAVSFWIAWQALRGYLASGLIHLLVLGCALLPAGIAAFLAGFVIDQTEGVNKAVTVFSAGFLLSAVLHFVNAILLDRETVRAETEASRKLISSIAYLVVFMVIGGIWAAAQYHDIPPFYEPGVGPTTLRQVVLTSAILLFVVASHLIGSVARQRRVGYLLWYGYGLGLIALGLFGVALSFPGSPLSWAGRALQYLGTLYLLAAAVTAVREARHRGMRSWEQAVQTFFRESEGRYRTLVESARSSIVSVDRQGRVFLWNPSAERLFGYSANEVMGQVLTWLITPPGSREELEGLIRKSPHGVHEFTLRRKDGSEFAAEFTVYGLTGREEKSLNIRDITERKRAEESLRLAYARSEWLARFPEENPNPVMRVTSEGEALYCNPAATELDGWKCKVDQKLSEPLQPMVGQAMAEGREVKEDVNLGERAYAVSVVPIPGAGYANVYGQDITERKQAKAELQKAKAELEERVKERTYELYTESLYARSLIEASLDPLVTISVDGKITDVNHASEEVTGVPRARLIGSDFSDYFTEPEKARAGYEEVFRLGFVQDYPLELKHRNGQVTPVLYNASVYRDETGQILGVFAAARDITERKRTEETVKAERQRLYDVLETLPVYAILLTPDYHVPFANRFFRERFGEDRGKRCYDYLFNRVEPCEICETYTVQKTGKPHHWEWTGPDGRNYDIFDYPFRDSDGSPLIMEVGIDITERKRAEAALRKLASELVMAEERERKRIAGVLHDEVAQTLAAARMRIDMLKDAPPSDREQTLKDAKALLVQSIQETRALMNDLGNPLLFDMGLQAACEALANSLMDRHPIRIACDIRDAFKYVNPDVKTILYQLIRELLNNVVKHSHAQNAQVLLDMNNGQFRAKVTDDGVGFDPQMLGSPTAEGGFGLYSIRERLIAINGTLRIESAPGSGTIVTAILPAVLD